MHRQNQIKRQIESIFSIQHLDIVDESDVHARPGSETHLKLTLVSDQFEGISRVQRHQQVYTLLQSHLASGLHALALHLYTPQEWLNIQQVPASPTCRGGEHLK